MARQKRYTRSITLNTPEGPLNVGQVLVVGKPKAYETNHHWRVPYAYDVEAIIGERVENDGRVLYLAKRDGFAAEAGDWEAKEAFTGAELGAWEEDKKQLQELDDETDGSDQQDDGVAKKEDVDPAEAPNITGEAAMVSQEAQVVIDKRSASFPANYGADVACVTEPENALAATSQHSSAHVARPQFGARLCADPDHAGPPALFTGANKDTAFYYLTLADHEERYPRPDYPLCEDCAQFPFVHSSRYRVGCSCVEGDKCTACLLRSLGQLAATKRFCDAAGHDAARCDGCRKKMGPDCRFLRCNRCLGVKVLPRTPSADRT